MSDDLSEAVELLLDIPEGTPAVLVEEAAHDVVAELDRLRAIELRARKALGWGDVSNARLTARYILGEDG